jgi:hypothetical protein
MVGNDGAAVSPVQDVLVAGSANGPVARPLRFLGYVVIVPDGQRKTTGAGEWQRVKVADSQRMRPLAGVVAAPDVGDCPGHTGKGELKRLKECLDRLARGPTRQTRSASRPA